MNYQNLYNNIVKNAKERTKDLEKYVIENKIHYKSLPYQARYIKEQLIEKCGYKAIECHHITPKSDGGKDDLENIVFFTPKEHVIAHHVLYKAFPTNKHFLAWHYLTMTDRKKQNLKNRLTPKQYEELSIKNREISLGRKVEEKTRKKLSILNSGENNAMWGKHWYNNGKVSVACFENEIPEGFVLGRINVIPKEHHFTTNGFHFYNNGVKNIMVKEGSEVPQGFVKGMKNKRKR